MTNKNRAASKFRFRITLDIAQMARLTELTAIYEARFERPISPTDAFAFALHDAIVLDKVGDDVRLAHD